MIWTIIGLVAAAFLVREFHRRVTLTCQACEGPKERCRSYGEYFCPCCDQWPACDDSDCKSCPRAIEYDYDKAKWSGPP